MKIFLYTIFPFLLLSCCFGNRKCNQDNNSAKFRIVSNINGQDLVFGPGKIYDKDQIKFYSLNGADTIFHQYGAGPNPNPGQDSLLFVSFDYKKYETVYQKLSNTDVDTIKIAYQLIDASPCCSDYFVLVPELFNNQPIGQISGGITILKK